MGGRLSVAVGRTPRALELTTPQDGANGLSPSVPGSPWSPGPDRLSGSPRSQGELPGGRGGRTGTVGPVFGNAVVDPPCCPNWGRPVLPVPVGCCVRSMGLSRAGCGFGAGDSPRCVCDSRRQGGPGGCFCHPTSHASRHMNPSPTAEPGVPPGPFRLGPFVRALRTVRAGAWPAARIWAATGGEEPWEASTHSRLCFCCRKAPVILLLGLSSRAVSRTQSLRARGAAVSARSQGVGPSGRPHTRAPRAAQESGRVRAPPPGPRGPRLQSSRFL